MTDTTLIVEEDISIIQVIEDAQVISTEDVSIIQTTEEDAVVILEQEPIIIESVEQGPIGPPGPAGDEEMPYDVLVDEINDEGDLYVGRADPGSATSASVWQIYFLDNIGVDLSKRYADGSAEFNKVWDNRSSYSY